MLYNLYSTKYYYIYITEEDEICRSCSTHGRYGKSQGKKLGDLSGYWMITLRRALQRVGVGMCSGFARFRMVGSWEHGNVIWAPQKAQTLAI
jgi:hypothetical protein